MRQPEQLLTTPHCFTARTQSVTVHSPLSSRRCIRLTFPYSSAQAVAVEGLGVVSSLTVRSRASAACRRLRAPDGARDEDRCKPKCSDRRPPDGGGGGAAAPPPSGLAVVVWQSVSPPSAPRVCGAPHVVRARFWVRAPVVLRAVSCGATAPAQKKKLLWSSWGPFFFLGLSLSALSRARLASPIKMVIAK